MTWYYPAPVGGVTQMTHNLASQMASRGHTVDVWTSDYWNGRAKLPERVLEKSRIYDGVNVFYHRSFFLRRQARTKQAICPQLTQRLLTIKAEEYDIVHIPESRSFPFLMAALLVRTPVVHSAYGSLGAKPRSWKRAFYDRLVLRPYLNRTGNAYLAQTKHEIEVYKSYLSSENHGSVHLFPLAVDVVTNKVHAEKHAGLLRKALSLSADDRLILFLGRLTENKGIERLMLAFAQARLPQTHLAIVGYDEGMKEALLSLRACYGLGNTCHFIDSVHGPARFGCYADADLFAMTSTYFEETSLASLEALSVGTPCLVTPEAEIPYLEEYDAGFQACSNVEDISIKMQRLVHSCREKRSGALQLAKHHFDIEVAAEKLEKIYFGLCRMSAAK